LKPSHLRTSAAIGPVAALVIAFSLMAVGCGDGPRAPKPSQEPESGESSIEGFGSEASGAQRVAILAAEQGYLNALAGRDYKAACASLSASVISSLRKLASPSPRREGCEAILPTLLSPQAAETSRQAAEGQIARVRVKGSQAFVLYRAPGARLYLLTMVREGAGWKAATLGGSILVPSPSTFE
jgi:hypothetical protein